MKSSRVCRLRAAETVRVSVIIPCHNEEDCIEACVRSILTQDPPAGGFEIIIADGMSTDRTRPILNRLTIEHDRLRVIDNPSRFVSSGLNAALAVARGKFIVRMDAHTCYARDYVRQCIAVLEETGADNVGGPWTARGEGWMGRAIAAAFQSPFAAGGARGHDIDYEGPLDTVYLGCWPREVFALFGLFDEEIVRNQDDEFNLRILRSGGKIWQSPRIKSWYQTRSSLGDLFHQYRQYGYWKFRVIQKHRLPASIRHVVPAGFLLSLGVLLVASWWPPAFLGLVGLLAVYVICNVAASIVTAGKNGWTLLPILPIVFATYHFSYGLGFLQGILDFLLLRRGPRPSLVAVSRRSVAH
jgi:succinoglycan biosynthesis protein ExoA